MLSYTIMRLPKFPPTQHVLASLLMLSSLWLCEFAQVEAAKGMLRVLVVGDSITHCNEGDYTWR